MWGIGVTSLILVIRMPAADRDRMAASRPLPGPLTKTSTSRSPWSVPFSGRLVRPPLGGEGGAFAGTLEPHCPGAAPGYDVPVRVGERYLGVVEGRLDVSPAHGHELLFSPSGPSLLLGHIYLFYFLARTCLRPATVLLAPLLVLALVLVRCPCTGSPRRCLMPR